VPTLWSRNADYSADFVAEFGDGQNKIIREYGVDTYFMNLAEEDNKRFSGRNV
jgi:hypothetical protein